MTLSLKSLILIAALAPLTLLSSCVIKQTTTREGAVVDEKYIIKRPVKNFIENVEVE